MRFFPKEKKTNKVFVYLALGLFYCEKLKKPESRSKKGDDHVPD